MSGVFETVKQVESSAEQQLRCIRLCMQDVSVGYPLGGGSVESPLLSWHGTVLELMAVPLQSEHAAPVRVIIFVSDTMVSALWAPLHS
jgi:hypothetical protein